MLRRVLVLIAALSMGASFIFTWRTSAHNIDLAKAKELVRDYARAVRAESKGMYVDDPNGYIHSTWGCVNAFPNHNHIVRCGVQHQIARDKAAGVYTCRETLELYMAPHSGGKYGPIYRIYARHTSGNTCGGRYLKDFPIG